MYLIELKPGKEAVYGTLTDFVEAVRRGEIGWQARIYHRAKSMWVPVTVHPHFRKLAGRAAAQASVLPRDQWTFFPAEPGRETQSRQPAQVISDGSQPVSGPGKAAPAKPKAGGWRNVLGGLIGPHRD